MQRRQVDEEGGAAEILASLRVHEAPEAGNMSVRIINREIGRGSYLNPVQESRDE